MRRRWNTAIKFKLMLGIAGFAVGAHAAIPENDSFAARIALFGSSVATTGSNVGATKEVGEPDENFTGGKSVWWTWTAPSNGNLTVTTAGSSFDTTLAVYTGSVLTNLTLVAFNDTDSTTSLVNFNVTAGTAYQIQVDGCDSDYYETNNTEGNISLQLTLGATLTPPANDNFANRITLSGTHINNENGSNVGATAEPGEPFHADSLGLKSVWWTWTAPSSGALTLFVQGNSTRGGALDTVLAVYTGNSVSNLTVVAANDEDEFGYESLLTCNVTSNVIYQIAVDGFEGDEGSLRLDLDLNASLAVPANDNFAKRITLTGSTINTNWSNVGATYEPNEPMHLVTFGGKSVWWTWTAPASGGVTLTASNSALDTLVAVYTGNSLANLVFVAGNDEDYFLSPTVDGDSTAYFNVTSGTTYQIVVDGADGASGNFNLRLTLGAADAVPANNNFANRITLSGTNVTTTGSNLGATLEVGEPLHRGYYGGSSVWWNWTSPGPGFVTIDTTNTTTDVPDTLLAVYTGSSLSALTEIASDNNSGGGNWASRVTFATKSSVTYQIAVDGTDGDSWNNVRLNIHYLPAAYSLTVTTNPAGAGSVSLNPLPDQAGKYMPGTVVTLTASAGSGNTFTGWTGDTSATNNPLVLTMSSNKTIVAGFFVPPTVRVWTGASASSGNWSQSQNWAGGTPNAGDDLIFPAGASRLTSNTNDFAANTTFDSITLGDAYILRGNAINLNGGIVATNTSGTNTVSLNVTLNSNQIFRSGFGPAALVMAGNVALGSRTLTAETIGSLALSGVISGTGGLTKTNAGTLSLTGSSANTYSGATVVNEGTLELGKTGVAVTGALTIGDGLGGANADVVRFTGNSQLATSSAVTINSSGRLDLNGFTGVVGSLTMTGGNVDTGAGSLGLNGNFTGNANSATASIAGNLSLQGATRTFTVADGSAAIDLLISAVVANGGASAGITKAGNGTLQLAAANNYSGTTTVSAGALAVLNAAGLGTTAQGTVVTSNAVLSLNGITVSGEALTLTAATLQSDAGSNAWTGNLTLSNTCFFSVATNVTLNLPGVLSGAGAVTKTGDGSLIFSGAATNSYTGVTTVSQGTLALAKSISNAVPSTLVIGDGSGGTDADVLRLDAGQQIPTGTLVTLNNSGLLNMNNFSDSFASLSGSGHVEFGGASAVLTIGGTGASSTFNGLISGAGQLVKAGNGTFTLTANNSYTGQTTVSGGTLIVNGTQSGSAVVVNSPGVLGGSGRVGNLSGTGTVSPGSSPGMLSSGNVIFSSNTTFRVELNGTTVGSGYDQLNVSGTVNLAGTLNATLGFTPALNDSFTIVANNASDAVTGAFNGLAEGAYFPIGGKTFRITYAGGTGNDVVLWRTNAPAAKFDSISRLPGGANQISGTGLSNLTYTIQAASNLSPVVQWTQITNVTANSGGTFFFVDSNAPAFSMRFYRALSQ